MFPNAYFAPTYFASVYWEPVSGGGPPPSWVYFIQWIG